jgi:uncharacterized protein
MNQSRNHQSNKHRGLRLPTFLFSLACGLILCFSAAQNSFGQAACTSTQVVINEVYTEGGLTGAAYKNDFVELYNRTASACNLTNYSIQVAAGNANNFPNVFAFPANSIIPASGYYLIQFGSSGAIGATLPSADFSAVTNLSTDGKVALVNNPASLSGNCASNLTNAMDFVGYGVTNCYKGTGAAQYGSAINSAERISPGYNTNNNVVDFVVRPASPRNTLSPTAASASVSGRVTRGGTGVYLAKVYLTNQNGEVRTATTNTFGYYSFKEVAAGETYIFSVFSKCCSYAPQVVSVQDSLTGLDFEALQ